MTLLKEHSSNQKTQDDSGNTTRISKLCCLCNTNEGEQVYQRANLSIVRCSRCGLVYVDENKDNIEHGSLYRGDFYKDAYIFSPDNIDTEIAKDYLCELQRIDKCFPAGGRLLDFGCARGSFIQALIESAKGARWQCEGIDINADEIALGQSKGLPVRVANLIRTDIPSESYDIVTAFSVLEHTQNPREILMALARIMKTKGILLLITPNHDSLLFSIARLISHLSIDFIMDKVFYKGHLFYFNQKTMCQILNDTGFRIVEIDFMPSYVETHATRPLVALVGLILRFCSWIVHRQTMLITVAEKR